jgi:redox-sensitive bicupin YhaK (pirin superfamily)
MKTILHKADSRGHADHGWLNAHHSFSFAGYHDPERIHFGALRVLNDDIVAGGMGFGAHSHDNMEIITIPLSGQLEHKDSMGNTGVISKGEVQVMSAGTGIQHSEKNKNPDQPVNLLQIWVFPDKKNVAPRYDQKAFDLSAARNRLLNIVSPMGSAEGLNIHQHAWFHLGKLDKDFSTAYD